MDNKTTYTFVFFSFVEWERSRLNKMTDRHLKNKFPNSSQNKL